LRLCGEIFLLALALQISPLQKSKFINAHWDELSDACDEQALFFDDFVGTSLALLVRRHCSCAPKIWSKKPMSAKRSDLLESRINCLKVLALSLLREIASVEKVGESEVKDTIDLHAEVQRFEVELIRSALIQTGGRQRPAARLLGTKITTLNTKIKRYKIEVTQTDASHFG
jgi:hypothetical protein